MGGNGLVEFSNHPGKEWQWRIQVGILGGIAYKCDVTNYSDSPIIDVELVLDLSFYNAVPAPNQPNSISMGDLILRRPWVITIPNIDTGPSNSFSFYIYNGTDNNVDTVILPHTAELRGLAEATRQTSKLDVSQLGGNVPLQLWPIRHYPPEK
jgi:hypothetical protein